MIIINENAKFQEFRYDREESFEKEIIVKSKCLFGDKAIYIDAKRRIESKALGSAIPDGFLFDLSEKDNPEFYIVEVELASHDFYKHIFPQITKFFAFFRNTQNQSDLVEKIFSIINNDPELKREFKKHIGELEIYKFIKDLVDGSQNILLILDGEKVELPEIMDTYSDTWGKMVKVLKLRKFTCGDKSIFTLDPDFESIEYAYAEPIQEAEEAGPIEYSEEFHLETANKEIKETWYKLKEELLKLYPSLIFNPTKYYISIKLGKSRSYFHIRKSRIRLTVMLPEIEIKKGITKHAIVRLSESAQKFWGGPSCDIIIENSRDLSEIITALKPIFDRPINDK
jgi:hypothetical protein